MSDRTFLQAPPITLNVEAISTRDWGGSSPNLLWSEDIDSPELIGASFAQSPSSSYESLRERLKARNTLPFAVDRLEGLCSYSNTLPSIAFCRALSSNDKIHDLMVLSRCALEGLGNPLSTGGNGALRLLALGELAGYWKQSEIGMSLKECGVSVPPEFPRFLTQARRELRLLASILKDPVNRSNLADLPQALREVRAEANSVDRVSAFVELLENLSSKRELLFISPEDAIDIYLPRDIENLDRSFSAFEWIKRLGSVERTQAILALTTLSYCAIDIDKMDALRALSRLSLEGDKEASLIIEDLLSEGELLPQELSAFGMSDSSKLWIEERLLQVERNKKLPRHQDSASASTLLDYLYVEDNISEGGESVGRHLSDVPKVVHFWNVTKIPPFAFRSRTNEYRMKSFQELLVDAGSTGLLTREQVDFLLTSDITSAQEKHLCDMTIAMLSIFRFRLSEMEPDLPADEFQSLAPMLSAISIANAGIRGCPIPLGAKLRIRGETFDIPFQSLSIPVFQLLLGLEKSEERSNFLHAIKGKYFPETLARTLSEEMNARLIIALLSAEAGECCKVHIEENKESLGRLVGIIANDSVARGDTQYSKQLSACVELLGVRSPALERFVISLLHHAPENSEEERRLIRLLGTCSVGSAEAIKCLAGKLKGQNGTIAVKALGNTGVNAIPVLEQAFDLVPIKVIPDQFDRVSRELTEYHQNICDALAKMGKLGALALLRIDASHDFETTNPLLRRALKEAGERGLSFDIRTLLLRVEKLYGGVREILYRLEGEGHTRAKEYLNLL